MLVLVTGASKGIGLEIVKKLSKDAGIFVIAVSRNVKPVDRYIARNNATNILAITADITDPAKRKKIFSAVKKLNMGLNVLINNAGEILNKPFVKISEKELRSVFETNVFAPFHLVQTLMPLFDQRTRTHVVNIASMGGFQGSVKFPGLTAYSSSKAALCNLTECLAEELKMKNMAINCLAIGAVQTEMLEKAFPGYKAPLKAAKMAEFIGHFALNGHHYFNGKIIPVSLTTP